MSALKICCKFWVSLVSLITAGVGGGGARRGHAHSSTEETTSVERKRHISAARHSSYGHWRQARFSYRARGRFGVIPCFCVEWRYAQEREWRRDWVCCSASTQSCLHFFLTACLPRDDLLDAVRNIKKFPAEQKRRIFSVRKQWVQRGWCASVLQTGFSNRL